MLLFGAAGLVLHLLVLLLNRGQTYLNLLVGLLYEVLVGHHLVELLALVLVLVKDQRLRSLERLVLGDHYLLVGRLFQRGLVLIHVHKFHYLLFDYGQEYRHIAFGYHLAPSHLLGHLPIAL